MKREITVATRFWSRKEQRHITGSIVVRLCDVDGCEDNGSKWYFPGGRCYCSNHKHLAEKQED